ncbi:putative aldehyde reductase [Thozetella sp. PMI_491]|nr:putative aldehyde reductase [Thozetella sp. PMI_491]
MGDPDTVTKALDALAAGGVRYIDVAQNYGDAEALLGNLGAGKRGFTINTKDSSMKHIGKEVEERAVQSLQRLDVSKVDVFFLHHPDTVTPFSEYLPNIDKLHKQGLFDRFGVSNYPPDLVDKTYQYCKEHGLVLPTVYQGNYNILSRRQETVLFPTLRKLGISFQAYSVMAGGFLSKSRDEIAAGAGRFNAQNIFGPIYLAMYAKPLLLEALEEWEDIAKAAGCTKGLLAYRWARYHSALKGEYGDGMIIGGATVDQIREAAEGINEGPLREEIVQRLEAFWTRVEPESPLDNFTDVISKRLP